MTTHNSVTAERKHTPTPWKVGSYYTHIHPVNGRGAICKFESIHGLYDNYIGNAELIVKAVNEREALLNTCAELRKALEKIERNAARALREGVHSSEQHNTLKFIRDNARDFLALTAAQSSEGEAG